MNVSKAPGHKKKYIKEELFAVDGYFSPPIYSQQQEH